ncbi:MAG: NAD(P)/FAD-dependent oxidoreductase, partial [Trebonia sp.]
PDLYDVVVIGGGPGGAVSGTLLADSGKQVLLLEAEKFPRYHVGESLLSGTEALLKQIGVIDELENGGYIKKYGVEWVWGENREPWTIYFKDAVAMPFDHGYQVERDKFDKLLLDNALKHGVDVREEHKVTDFAIGADGRSTVTFKDPAGVQTTVRTRWVIDASGQGGMVTKRLHKQEWDPYLKNLAIWTYWTGAQRSSGLDAGNTFTPSFDEGWFWFIPLRDDRTSVGMVVDREMLGATREAGVETYYTDCVARTPELARRLEGAQRADKIHVARDWSYSYDRFSGDGYIAVGDAACFIDPLFSTGVHLAMLSGFLAAVSVNTVLDKPGMGLTEVLDFYESTYRKEFSRLRAQVYFLYSGHSGSKESYFWHARNQFDVPGIEPEKAFISLIAGAFQHRTAFSRYLQRIDLPGDLRSAFESVIDGKSVGIGVDPHQTVACAPGVTYVDELAVDGMHLRHGRSVSIPSGVTLPLTPQLEQLVTMADSPKTVIELIDALASDGTQPRDSAQGLVHVAVSYGLLKPVA